VKGLKTSTSQMKRRVEPDTPASTRKRVEAETREARRRGRRARERRRCSVVMVRHPSHLPRRSRSRGAPRKRVKTLIRIAEEAETRAARRRGEESQG